MRSVLMLDLDGFKPINDRWGHRVGDGVLVAIAHRLSALSSDAVAVARLGGDEFALVELAPASGRSPAPGRALAEIVLTSLSAPCVLDGIVIRVSASIGIAALPAAADRAEAFQQADLAMYAAKRGGGSACRTFTPSMVRSGPRDVLLEAELRSTLSGDSSAIRTAYQPVIELASMTTVAAEALVRWHDPQITPSALLAVAETSGLMPELSRVVIERAVRRLASRASGSVAVNVSAAELVAQDFVAEALRRLDNAGVNPARLALEVQGPGLLPAVAQQLVAVGISLVLDDFTASIDDLERLGMPGLSGFGGLKISASLVADIGRSTHAEAVLESIIRLTQIRELTCTALGVETADQLAWLQDRGCEQAQGYLLGQPTLG